MNTSSDTRHVSLLATGAHLPGDPIGNETLAALCGELPADILDEIQVLRRHWLIDPATGAHRIGTSGMAVAAARQAIARAGIDAADIDLLVLSTASPEYPLPATVTYVQEQLGLERCAAIEFRAGCVGAVQGLDYARRLLADGTYRTAVVIGAEAISPLFAPLFIGQDPGALRLRDLLTVYTFGDGAGAQILRAGEPGSADPTGEFAFATQCLGGARKPGMQIIGGGTHAPAAEQVRRKRLVEMKLDVSGTQKFGPRVFAAGLSDLLSRSGLAVADLDACVVPEGNAEYFAKEFAAAGVSAADQAALAKSMVENLADVGATGSAAVPIALDAGWVSGRIQPGDTVALLAVEASRYLYAGLTLTWEAPTPNGTAHVG
ncbi:ketoacyl-ACP synthase III [Nocardia sp. 2]|uniref:Ketoacyl-ACP synthase III n=1 Tax=Nocardia acididurans TaxID=2802282 RepID=A0ABS1M717_9NOCA|nr:ketoacyl-ACP synthase III [Nocardia acididurans]